MATVVDELFNDFEDSGSEQGDDHDVADAHNESGATSTFAEGMDLGVDEEAAAAEGLEADMKALDEAEDEEDTKARVERMQLGGVSDVRSVAHLMKDLKPILEAIDNYKKLPQDQQSSNVGKIEDNPEYQLLTQANQISTRIDGDIFLVHKWIRDHYSTRFPELDTLIQNPVEYAKTVAAIGNGPMDNVRQHIQEVLKGPSLMVVTMEATTSAGQALPEDELRRVQEGCQMLLQLDDAKRVLRDYVQSKMSLFAPNLTTLIGSLTAAQLIGHTGGISGLAKTPANNLAALGSNNKRAAAGLASNIGVRQQGFVYNNDIIKEVPTDLKKQAMRILTAKIVLAARVDQAHQSPGGEQGLEFYDQVEKRINKLSEAAPNSGIRALPAPDEKPARKRGGRRARKAKEATAMTDLRKAQNRMAFGKEEAEVGYGDSTKGLGMIGAQDDGRIRAQQVDQRTRAKLSKKNPGWGGATPASSGTATSLKGFGGGGMNTFGGLKAAGLRTTGVGSGMKTQIGNTGGTTSTIAFTPVQGLELVNPQARAEMDRKRKAEEDRWFKGGTFTQLGGTNTNAPKLDAQGFKVPALPNKKAKTDATFDKNYGFQYPTNTIMAPVHDAEWLEFEKAAGGRTKMSSNPDPSKRVEAMDRSLVLMSKLLPETNPEIKTFDEAISQHVKVRVYTLPNASKNTPIVVFFHGGGWLFGNLDTEDHGCRVVCDRNQCVVVSVDYRLAPKAQFPTILDDGYAGYLWAQTNATRFGADPARCILWGGSAGGGLAISVAARVVSKKQPLAGLVVMAPFALHPTAVPAKYKSLHTSYVDNAGEIPVIRDVDCHGAWKAAASAQFSNPAYFPIVGGADAVRNFPPTYIHNTDAEIMRDDGRVLEAELQEMGVPVKRDVQVGFPHYFWCFPIAKGGVVFRDMLVGGFNWVLNHSSPTMKASL